MKYCPICGKEFEDGVHCPRDGAVLILSHPAAESLIGQVLKGAYRIDEKIGEGGMGVVFRGVQMALQRTVAIKVLLPEMQSTPSMVRRFFQEARLLSQLNHPHVVSVIDFGNTETGTLFMVMEYLEGQTLRELILQGGGLPLGRATRLMEQICVAVSAAHDRQLIHRDLKPDNIFIATRQSAPEAVKILDFGLARALAVETDTRLTQTGFLMGTAGFVAPEQITGGEADSRSDVYALGAILYFLLTGALPFRGKGLQAILASQLQEPPDVEDGPLAEHPELARVVLRAMSLDPTDRFQDARSLFEALRDAAAPLEPSLRVGPEAAAFAAATKTVVSPHRPQLPAASTDSGTSGEVPQSLWPARQASAGTGPMPERSAPPVAKHSWWIYGVVAVVVLATLSLAAWYWADGSEPAVSPSAAVDGPILVGMSAAFSGPSRELGRAMQLGIDTCFADVNERGGIAGRPLQLIALDDGYEPAKTVANMTELVLERNVLAVLGNVGTPTAEVALPLSLEQGVPFVGAFSGASLLRMDPPDPLVFNLRASYAEETLAIVDHFIDGLGLRPEQIAVFAQEDTFGDEGYQGVVRALVDRGYSDEVPRFGYRRNTQSIDRALDGLLHLGSDLRGVVLVATYRAAAQLIGELKGAGPNPDIAFAGLSFVGSNAFAQELVGLGPGIAEGVIVTQVVPHFDSDSRGVLRYRELMAKTFPAEQPGFVSLEGYLAARVFASALRGISGEITGETIATAMESLDAVDLGIGAEIRFGPQRHQGLHRVWGTVLDRSGAYLPLELSQEPRGWRKSSLPVSGGSVETLEFSQRNGDG